MPQLLQQEGVEESGVRPAVGKVCPLPCSLVPKPRLGWRGPVPLHDLPVSALRKKLLLLGPSYLPSGDEDPVWAAVCYPGDVEEAGEIQVPGVWPPGPG